MIAATKLVFKEGTTLDLYFLDGTVKRYNVLSLIDKYPQLKELKNKNLFLKGRLLGWSTVYWNDELDISVEDPYYDGEDVTNQYDDIENVTLGYKIKQKRLELELSQEELAKRVGIDQSDLSKIEKGNANPSIKMIHKIVSGLNGKISIDIK